MTVGRVRHYLCYECMTKFAIDVMEYTRQNLTDEFKSYMEEIGYKPNY